MVKMEKMGSQENKDPRVKMETKDIQERMESQEKMVKMDQ